MDYFMGNHDASRFASTDFGSLEMLHRIMTNLPEPREVFRSALSRCMSENPDSIRWIVALMAPYLHVGPFSRDVVARIENIMATLEPRTIKPRADRAGKLECRDVMRSTRAG